MIPAQPPPQQRSFIYEDYINGDDHDNTPDGGGDDVENPLSSKSSYGFKNSFVEIIAGVWYAVRDPMTLAFVVAAPSPKSFRLAVADPGRVGTDVVLKA